MQTIHYNISDKKALSTPDKPVLVAGESGTSEIVLSTVPAAWDGFEVRALLTTPTRILVDAFAVGDGFPLTNTMLDAQGYLYIEFVAYRGGTEIDRSLPDILYVNAGRKELGDIDPAPLPDLVAEMVAAKGDCEGAADAAVLATERTETTDAEMKAAEAIRVQSETGRTMRANTDHNTAAEDHVQAGNDHIAATSAISTIGAIDKGSPSGTYATTTALAAAFPTGNANVYVVTADGGWYYWSGTAWLKGGTYQSTGIVEDDVFSVLGIPNPQPNINMTNMPLNSSFETDSNSDGFADGFVVWTNGVATLDADCKVGLRSQKLSYTNSSGASRDVGLRGIETTNYISAVKNDKIYLSMWIKKTANHTATASLKIGIREYTAGAVAITAPIVTKSITSEWAKYSAIITVSDVKTARVVLLLNITAATETVTEYLIDAAMMVNLTTSFGSGSEPTVDKIDAMMLSAYPSTQWFLGNAKVPYVGYNNNKITSEINGIVKMATLSEVAAAAEVGLMPIPDTGEYFSTDTINFALQLLGRQNKYANINKFVGKKAGFLGDSISAKTLLTDQSKVYYTVAGNKMQFLSSVADSWVGAAISREASYTDKRFTKRYLSLPSDLDVIGVFGGVNDFAQSATMGAISDAPTDADNVSFYGSLKFLIEGLITKYPFGRIFFVTPIHYWSATLAYGAANSAGKTMTNYVTAIRDVCEWYGIPVCDLYKNCELYPYSENQRASWFLGDGCHPNAAGHARMAEKISSFMESL